MTEILNSTTVHNGVQIYPKISILQLNMTEILNSTTVHNGVQIYPKISILQLNMTGSSYVSCTSMYIYVCMYVCMYVRTEVCTM